MSEFTIKLITGEESSCSGNSSILKALRAGGINRPDAPCGGTGKCGKCRITVTGAVRELSTGRIFSLDGERISACRFAPAGDIIADAEEEQSIIAVGSQSENIAGGGTGLGLAADIGTTTVVSRLYALTDGGLLAERRAPNAQRFSGADVMSRIEYCRKGGLGELAEAIRGQLAAMAEDMCAQCGAAVGDISAVSVAGNTVMEHIAAGEDPSQIAVPPYRAKELFGRTVGGAYLAPCVSGYVGGDITAGLASCAALTEEGLVLYVDIGTNGEMALGNKDGFVCCAAAAGPAFEGAEISCGISGVPGAIDKITVSNGDIAVHTIGGAKPVGICGSGLADAVNALLRLGVITRRGSIQKRERLSAKLAKRLITTDTGENAVLLADGVCLTAKDIRQYQLAKAAIRAGVDTLLASCGRTAADITALIIAGGFGSKLDTASVFATGLLPEMPDARIYQVGNASLAGASAALTEKGRADAAACAAKMKYTELSTDALFSERFLKSLNFR